jgi:hypothetical protein
MQEDGFELVSDQYEVLSLGDGIGVLTIACLPDRLP